MASNSSEQAAPTKLCGNCKKEVLSANYDMHSVHCQRFMKYCDYCDQSFSKNEWEEHIKTFHGEVCCKDCGISIEKKHMEGHEKEECRFRPQTCDYCNLSLPDCRFAEHENFCGSRTELCQLCNKYVKLRDLERHVCEEVPAAEDRPGFDGPAEFGFDGDFDEDFHEAPMFVRRFCDFCNKPESALGMPISEHKELCPEQPVSCKFCDDKVPMLFLESHEAVCPGMSTVCPTCHESLRFDQIAHHADTCHRQGPQNFERDVAGRQFRDLGRDRQNPGSTLKDFGGLMIKEGKVTLPCEFCHRLFSTDMLIQHESACNRADPTDPRLGE